MDKRKTTNTIIFHHSLSNFGDVDEIRRWHLARPGYKDIGYHEVVLKDGTIQHGRDYHLMGAHAQGRNSDSIGVCLIGNFNNCEPTEEQLESCLSLYHGYCRIYNKNLHIQFHRSVYNMCPGKMLNKDDFLEIVSRGMI